MGRMNELKTYVPPRNLALQGTSSWISYFLNRDSRPGQELVVIHGVGPVAATEGREDKREENKVKVGQ
jgi:hypothetical protein